MEIRHPFQKNPHLSVFVKKYPSTSGALFQVYNDIVYAQQWVDVEVVDLPECERGVIKGKKKDTDVVLHVVPCSLAETVSFAWLQAAFSVLSTPEIYLGITSEDASIVYYKMSQGIVKPSV